MRADLVAVALLARRRPELDDALRPRGLARHAQDAAALTGMLHSQNEDRVHRHAPFVAALAGLGVYGPWSTCAQGPSSTLRVRVRTDRGDFILDNKVGNPELTGGALFKDGTQTLTW